MLKRLFTLLTLFAFPSLALGQVEVTLKKTFVQKYADQATISSDFRVDVSSRIHPANQDGDIHVAGTSTEIGLPAVAEIMNAKEEKNESVAQIKAIEGSGQKLNFVGAWRIWPEHGGEPEVQGQPVDPINTSGIAHVFEIHPATKVGDHDVSQTWHPIDGYQYKDAETAFNAYERTHSHITVTATKITITTDVVTYNYPRFIIQLLSEPEELSGHDGFGVYAKIFSAERDLLVTKRRMILVKGTPPADVFQTKHRGDFLDVVGIPRINLKLVKWRMENFNKPQWQAKHPLDWNLPYEMIIVAVTDANLTDQ